MSVSWRQEIVRDHLVSDGFCERTASNFIRLVLKLTSHVSLAHLSRIIRYENNNISIFLFLSCLYFNHFFICIHAWNIFAFFQNLPLNTVLKLYACTGIPFFFHWKTRYICAITHAIFGQEGFPILYSIRTEYLFCTCSNGNKKWIYIKHDPPPTPPIPFLFLVSIDWWMVAFLSLPQLSSFN